MHVVLVSCQKGRKSVNLNWHPVALKVEVDDIPNLLCCTMLAGHHDVQQAARWIHLQSLTHPSGQAIRLGWPPILLQDTTLFDTTPRRLSAQSYRLPAKQAVGCISRAGVLIQLLDQGTITNRLAMHHVSTSA